MLVNNIGNTAIVFVVLVILIRFIRKSYKKDYMYLVNYAYHASSTIGIGQTGVTLDKKISRWEDVKQVERTIANREKGNVIILNYKLLRRA